MVLVHSSVYVSHHSLVWELITGALMGWQGGPGITSINTGNSHQELIEKAEYLLHCNVVGLVVGCELREAYQNYS